RPTEHDRRRAAHPADIQIVARAVARIVRQRRQHFGVLTAQQNGDVQPGMVMQRAVVVAAAKMMQVDIEPAVAWDQPPAARYGLSSPSMTKSGGRRSTAPPHAGRAGVRFLNTSGGNTHPDFTAGTPPPRCDYPNTSAAGMQLGV